MTGDDQRLPAVTEIKFFDRGLEGKLYRFFTFSLPKIVFLAFGTGLRAFSKIMKPRGVKQDEAVFLGFWLRFGSVTGRHGHAPSPKPRQNSKILAPRGYSISSNALEHFQKHCSHAG